MMLEKYNFSWGKAYKDLGCTHLDQVLQILGYPVYTDEPSNPKQGLNILNMLLEIRCKFEKLGYEINFPKHHSDLQQKIDLFKILLKNKVKPAVIPCFEYDDGRRSFCTNLYLDKKQILELIEMIKKSYNIENGKLKDN